MKFDLTCAKHPKYTAKRAPTTKCGACFMLYYLTQDRSFVTNMTETEPEYESTLLAKPVKD